MLFVGRQLKWSKWKNVAGSSINFNLPIKGIMNGGWYPKLKEGTAKLSGDKSQSSKQIEKS